MFTQPLMTALLLLCVPALCSANLLEFTLAEQKGYDFQAVFNWSDANAKYLATAKGVLTTGAAATKKELKLPVSKGSIIERVFFQSYDNDQLLAFETNNGEEAMGYVCRITLVSLKLAWCQHIPGFNVYPMMSNNALYVGAIGYVASINPASGKIIWAHDGLYAKDNTFNIVCPALETDTSIAFYATTGIKKLPVKKMTVDRKSGKILETVESQEKAVCL